MKALRSVDDLRPLIGQQVAVGEWHPITQQQINAFADATGDHQWIHIDAERAARDSPVGTTIAHGFLTLSLVSTMMRSAISIDGLRMTINYGLNRVRFVTPVPAGSRVRASIVLSDVTETADSVQASWAVTVEREGSEKPCLVAEWLVRYYA